MSGGSCDLGRRYGRRVGKGGLDVPDCELMVCGWPRMCVIAAICLRQVQILHMTGLIASLSLSPSPQDEGRLDDSRATSAIRPLCGPPTTTRSHALLKVKSDAGERRRCRRAKRKHPSRHV